MQNKNRDQTHELAREIVELALEFKGSKITTHNIFEFDQEFKKKHQLGTRSRPNTNHTYDIVTENEVIEIDDYGKHSKKNQKINDGIAGEYIKEYHPKFKFYRLQKEEIVNEKGQIQPTCADYLSKNLF